MNDSVKVSSRSFYKVYRVDPCLDQTPQHVRISQHGPTPPAIVPRYEFTRSFSFDRLGSAAVRTSGLAATGIAANKVAGHKVELKTCKTYHSE